MTALETLFDVWRSRDLHSGHAFISDGAIDPARWTQADSKVLFVAKEAYGEPGATATWDLPALVRDDWKGPKYKFWWTVGYWALAVRNTTIESIADFPEYTDKYDAASEAVLSSAILNLKKSGGSSSSEDEDLRRYVVSDAAMIRQEFDILDPDIVIFCNTWHLAQELWPEAEETSQFALRWGAPSKTFITYWHPANHFPSSVMFYALCAIYQKSLRANQALQADAAKRRR